MTDILQHPQNLIPEAAPLSPTYPANGSAQSKPTTAVQAGFESLWNRIETFRAFEADWDDEDAPPLDPTLITQAQAFVRHLAENLPSAIEEPLWLPSVFPTREGGIELYWNRLNDQQAITFRPGRSDLDYRISRPNEKMTEPISVLEGHGRAFAAIMGK